MSEPITTELRGKMDTFGWYDEDGNIVFATCGEPASEMACLVTNSKTFGELCDAIDAVHANLERENDELRGEWDYWESTHVELPKDADGEYIHIGDVMQGEKVGGGFCEPFEVVGYIMSNGELEPMDEHKLPRKRKYLHHHEPTVEDVLREFAQEMNENMGMYTGEAIDADEWRDADARTIAEYAAKLRLAGDAE